MDNEPNPNEPTPNEPAPAADAPAPAPAPNSDSVPAPENDSKPAPANNTAFGDDNAAAQQNDEGDNTPKNWPDNWREIYAGEDEKKLAKLKRYTDPKAALDALFSAQGKIGGEGAPTEFPKDGTDEDKALWRGENDIPKEWSDYDTSFDDGFKWGEADQPYVNAFLEKMHGQNANPALVKAGLESYKEILEEEGAARQAQDVSDKRDFEDEQRADWGSSYRSNINLVKNYLDTLPGEVSEGIQNGRGEDGKAFLNKPTFVNWLVNDVINQVNPEITILTQTGAKNSAGIDDELSEIAGKRKTNRKAYFADKDLLARERDLLDAQQKLKKK